MHVLRAKEKTTMHYLSIFFVLWWLPCTSLADQNINCAKPATAIKTAICSDRAYNLAEKNTTLNNLYKSKIHTPDVNLLKASQNQWISFRDSYCTHKKYDYQVTYCLNELYSDRINELENNLISFSYIPEKNPQKIQIGKLLSGDLTYSSELPESIEQGTETDIQLESSEDVRSYGSIIEITEGNTSLNLWSAISEYYGGPSDTFVPKWIKFYPYKNAYILVEVNSIEDHDAPTSSGIYSETTFTYSILTNEKKLYPQGTISRSTGNYISRLWKSWDTSQGLSLTTLKTTYRHDNYNYLLPHEYSTYSFNLVNDRGWIATKKTLDRDLEEPIQSSKYLVIFSNADSKIAKPEYQLDSEPCYENGINWSQVANSLNYWIDIAVKVEAETTRKQLIYALPKLFNYNKDYRFTTQQKAIAIGLNYYLNIIESTDNWKDKLNSIGTPEELSLETMTDAGFPAQNYTCSNEIRLNNFEYIKFNKWLYTFWLRRHLDGTYSQARQIVKYYAEH